ncbi:MAG: ABC transporter permease [Phycisphaerae bacterium]|nr:ABC transporter permease [Phycisphaerae bacterium]MCZ2401127.1 ABC transporter permease [Phycisphaerae bacterium]NUQ49165.1 ABC transporter permease [Phycisphaerae bacterium]
MDAVLALALKDLRLLLRDRVGFFFTFFFPILYASFFGMIFSGQAGQRSAIRIHVVDHDATPESRRFVERLAAGDRLECAMVENEAAANDAVRRGRVAACLVLPRGFGARYAHPFARGLPEIELRIDPSRAAESGMLQGLLAGALFGSVQDLMTDPNALGAMVDQSLAELDQAGSQVDPLISGALRAFLPALRAFVERMPRGAGGGLAGAMEPKITITPIERQRFGPRNAYEISFPQGIVWGMLGCAAGFGIALVQERTRGTLMRLRISPVSPYQILAGKALACFLTTVLVAGLLLGFGYVVFGVRPGSWPLLSVAVLCAAVAFVGIMQLLSVLGRTEQAAGGIGWAILTVMAMLGGGMVPLFFMPTWMQQIGSISPVKWVVYALEGAIWRGFSPAEMLLPCGVLVAIGVVTFAIGVRAFSWSDAR